MSGRFLGGLVKLRDLAAAGGALLVGFVQDAAGAVYRTVLQELRQSLDVAQFGAVSGGTVDASAAFQAALNAAQGRRLRIEGVYLLSAQVTMSDNTRLDLSKAKIIVGTTDHCIKAIGKKGITVIGGRFEPHPSIVTGVHPTGTYGASDALYFEGCEDCRVTQGHFTGFYGAVNFYNCSRCTAWENTLRDNAGGIQLLASSNFSGNPNCVGVSFHDNIALHSGDDAFSFLVGVDGGYSGSVALSSIVNNYVSKDANPSGKNTVGLSRGVALIGGQTNTANTIQDCVVAHNRGYMMGTEFVRVTGAVRVKISDNTCNGFAYSPDVTTSPAFTFGDRSTGQYGVIESVISGNSATDTDKLTKTFQFDGAQGCQIVDNFADSPVAGEGAMRFDNCAENEIRGNRAKNTSGFGIDLQATCSGNTVLGGSVSGSVVAIRNDGTGNLVENVRGVRKRTTGTTAIGSAATSVTVNHQIELLTSVSRLKVRVTANSPLYGASEFWVSNKGADYFDIRLDAVPGGANVVFFEWEAWEARD